MDSDAVFLYSDCMDVRQKDKLYLGIVCTAAKSETTQKWGS